MTDKWVGRGNATSSRCRMSPGGWFCRNRHFQWWRSGRRPLAGGIITSRDISSGCFTLTWIWGRVIALPSSLCPTMCRQRDNAMGPKLHHRIAWTCNSNSFYYIKIWYAKKCIIVPMSPTKRRCTSNLWLRTSIWICLSALCGDAKIINQRWLCF